MNKLVRTCGMAALMLCAVGVVSQAEAGGRRRSCGYNNQSNYGYQSNYGSAYYAAPAVTNSTVTGNGRQQYQSAYQAAAPVTTAPIYGPAPVYYSGNTVGPYDSSNYYFHEPRNAFDASAARKARDGRMQH